MESQACSHSEAVFKNILIENTEIKPEMAKFKK
jgi:hypothetical protein